jgi:hypothetical protein
MMKLYILISIASLIAFTVCTDTYNERLDIHVLPNNYYLYNFTFSFNYIHNNNTSNHNIDHIHYFPL